MKIGTVLLVIILSIIVLIGYSQIEPISSSSDSPSTVEEQNANTGNLPTKVSRDKGNFKLTYEKSDNKYYSTLQQSFAQDKTFEPIVNNLNDAYNLPYNINISFKVCKEANAFYEPENHSITMCYELVEQLGNTFIDNYDYDTDEALGTEIIYATIFIMYHEIGHSLIDAYDIPVTGKEEDAVDRMSTVILLQYDENMPIVVTAANAFLLLQENNENLAFWDEHSLGQQRYYDILCLAYGKNATLYAAAEEDILLETNVLPEERSKRCPYEYEQAVQSWATLLNPHAK